VAELMQITCDGQSAAHQVDAERIGIRSFGVVDDPDPRRPASLCQAATFRRLSRPDRSHGINTGRHQFLGRVEAAGNRRNADRDRISGRAQPFLERRQDLLVHTVRERRQGHANDARAKRCERATRTVADVAENRRRLNNSAANVLADRFGIAQGPGDRGGRDAGSTCYVHHGRDAGAIPSTSSSLDTRRYFVGQVRIRNRLPESITTSDYCNRFQAR